MVIWKPFKKEFDGFQTGLAEQRGYIDLQIPMAQEMLAKRRHEEWVLDARKNSLYQLEGEKFRKSIQSNYEESNKERRVAELKQANGMILKHHVNGGALFLIRYR